MINSATSTTATTTTITISGGDASDDDVPPPTTTRSADGSVNFENQNYDINIADIGEIKVTNKKTSEIYLIQSNLRVDVGGVQAFYFKSTTTFELDDGTKITVDTAPRNLIDYAMLAANAVAIFDGNSDYGVLIENFDSVRDSEITFEEVTKDELTELGIDGGNALSENIDGNGFVAIDEHGNVQMVDQEWVSDTDEILVRTRALYNQLSALYTQFSGIGNFISGISQISFSGEMLLKASQNTQRQIDHHPKSTGREFRPQVKCEPEDSIAITNTSTPTRGKSGDMADSSTKEIKQRFHFILARSLRSENNGI
jgi:hypothetical protein